MARPDDRVPSYDGLRALAVFLVIGAHANIGLFYGGAVGVDVFFVLSGFLITTLLLTEQRRTGRIALGRFYARRALRLLPGLFLLALVGSSYTVLFAPPWLREINLNALPPVLLYVANWAAASGAQLGFYGHTWSLAIEEQFYVAWPLLLVLLTLRERHRRLALVCGAGIVGALALRVLLWDGPESIMRIYNGLDTRADSLLAGCLLAAVLLHLPDARRAAQVLVPAGWAGGAFLVAWFLHTGIAHPPGAELGYAFTWGLSATALASAAVVGMLAVSPANLVSRVLGARPLAAAGRVSYGLYLFHPPVFFVVDHHAGVLEFYPRLLLKLALTGLAAAASYRWVELPFLRRKRNLRTASIDEARLPVDAARPFGL